MPIKQVSCCKCGNLVNKAQTYSIGKDQRACKTHEGVVERKAELEVAKIQQRKAEVRKLNAREERKAGGGWQGDPRIPRCWVCMNEGLRAEDFFTRCLVEQEKVKQAKPDASIFEIMAARPKERCIFVLAEAKCADAMKYVREDFKQLVGMGGYLSICGPCCVVAKIEPLAKVSPEQLKVGMLLAEMVKPEIEKQAKAELAKEAS